MASMTFPVSAYDREGARTGILLTGVSSCCSRCSRGSSGPRQAWCLGVGATASRRQPTGPKPAFGYRSSPRPISAQPAGAVIHGHSFCQPNHESSNSQQPSSCARSSALSPLPGTQLSCSSPRRRFTPIGRCSLDAPPSVHPLTRRLGWAAPQRQLNIHTRTRRPITDSISDATIAHPRPLALHSPPAREPRGNIIMIPIGNPLWPDRHRSVCDSAPRAPLVLPLHVPD